MKTSIFVPVGVVGAFVAAVVLASPMSTGTVGEPAVAPNRAEVFASATCADPAAISVSDQTSWQNALGSKRALERGLILASGASAVAIDCGPVKS